MARPDYTTRDPKGWWGDPRRGAALGRHDYHSDTPEAPVKLTLRRVRLFGDYDSLGTYWGGGAGTLPLYWYADDAGTIDVCLRARDRADAKRQIREHYPNAKFWR